MTRATSRQPPRIARRAWTRVTRQKVARRPRPRLRATSSWAGSALRKLGGDRQVDERVDGQRHHQRRRPEAVERREDRLPAEAGDEVGDADRDHDEHRPDPPPGKARSARRTTRRACRSRRTARVTTDGQADRVPQQRRGQLAEQQRPQRRATVLAGLEQEEGERRERDQRRPARRSPSRPHGRRAGRCRARGGRP